MTKIIAGAAWFGAAILATWTLTAALTGVAAQTGYEQDRIMHAVVVAEKNVKPYAKALGASVDEWGNISCQPGPDKVQIKQTTIYRVETAQSYYDLSKVCGMSGDFRWPKSYTANTLAPDYDTWQRYEQLRIGDHVLMRSRFPGVQLSVPRCKKLGMVSKAFTLDPLENITDPRAYSHAEHVYKSHCVYKVPIMDVRIKWSTTEVAGPGAHGTDTYDQTWNFRIVDRGPKTKADAKPIGWGYVASLRPAW